MRVRVRVRGAAALACPHAWQRTQGARVRGGVVHRMQARVPMGRAREIMRGGYIRVNYTLPSILVDQSRQYSTVELRVQYHIYYSIIYTG